MEFSEACCEVSYILEHLNPIDKSKIPESVFLLFKENSSIFFKVQLTTDKPLVEQELKEETKAFLQLIHYKYLANKKQKEEFKEILNKETEEWITEGSIIPEEKCEAKELVVYKENKIMQWIKKIIKFFKRS